MATVLDRLIDRRIAVHARNESQRKLYEAQRTEEQLDQKIVDTWRAHYEYERQKQQLEELRTNEHVRIPDDNLEELASLPADEFAGKYHQVRTCYQRETRRSHGGGSADDQAIMRRAVDYHTEHQCGYAKAKAAVMAELAAGKLVNRR